MFRKNYEKQKRKKENIANAAYKLDWGYIELPPPRTPFTYKI